MMHESKGQRIGKAPSLDLDCLGGQGGVEDETLMDAVAHDVSPSFSMANMA